MKRLAAVILPGLWAASLAAQVQVVARASDSHISEGQSFTYEIQVENGELDAVDLVGINDFRRLSGPHSSRSMQIINGQVKSSSSFTWELMPRRTGSLIIPAQTVSVRGRSYRTQPLAIEVTPASQSADSGPRGPLFLVAKADREGAYRGEQITITWTLYTQLNISGWEIASEPSLTGFWTEELFAPKKLQLRERTIGGQRYYTAVVRRAALFPTRSGELEIDPLILRIGVQTRNRNRDPFFDEFSFFGRRSVEQRTVSSAPLSLEVLPLPSAGQPKDYSGVVGNFSLKGHLSTSRTKQNEALTMSLTIAGDGNIKALEPPRIDFPAGLEVFTPQNTTESALGDVVGGSRMIEYVLIPRRAGNLTIPVVRFPVFNPRTKAYEVLTAGPFNLEVAPSADQAGAPVGFTREEVALLGEDIRFVKTAAPRWTKRGEGWYSRGLLLLNLLTVLLFAVPWLGGRAQRVTTRLAPVLRYRRALSRARQQLAGKGKPGADIYATFGRSVSAFINAKTGQNMPEYALQETLDRLASAGIDPGLRDTISGLLERAAAARFSPLPPEGADADRAELLACLAEVQRQWSD